MSNADKEGRILMVSERSTPSDQPTITIKYQLLDPSSSFSDVVTQARSVILAGGTMAPLDDFHSQLFPFVGPEKIVDFSCSHIVPPEHLLVRAVSMGPMGSNLQFKFSSKDDLKMVCMIEVKFFCHTIFPQRCFAVSCISTILAVTSARRFRPISCQYL